MPLSPPIWITDLIFGRTGEVTEEDDDDVEEENEDGVGIFANLSWPWLNRLRCWLSEFVFLLLGLKTDDDGCDDDDDDNTNVIRLAIEHHTRPRHYMIIL